MSPSAQREKLIDRVPGRPAPLGPSWIEDRRTDAATRLRKSGFPHRKVEAWRFTPVQPVIDVPFDHAPPGPGETDGDSPEAALARAAALVDSEQWPDDSYRIFVVGGRPFLQGEAPAGLEVRPVSEALGEAPALLEEHLGRLAEPIYFTALNTALFEEGLLLRAAEGARPERPIHVIHVGAPGARPVASYPRLLVVCEPGSETTLIETFVAEPGGAQLVCPVAEVVLGAGAGLEHVRAVHGTPGGFHVATLAVRQAKGSRYGSRVVTLGGGLSRLDLSVRLEGEGAECTLDGVYHTAGREAVDHHVFVDHVSPHGTSHQRYRGILEERGQAVFDGTIVVRKDAQRSDGHQENHNLLLSDDASINTKPHLEIEADDVSCSHGATIGALDEDQLFYLRARGIPFEQAEATLTYAFVRAVLERISHEPTRRRLAAAVLARLPFGDTIQDQDQEEGG